MKEKKKFKDTTVGRIALGAVGLINPTLGSILDGATSLEDGIKAITGADAPADDKIRAKELLLEAYEAEVQDRVAARNREALVAASGGSDILFKTIGWAIALGFLISNIAVFGVFGDIPAEFQGSFDRAYGAVNTLMVMVASYYFGSSLGSKQKTHLMKDAE